MPAQHMIYCSVQHPEPWRLARSGKIRRISCLESIAHCAWCYWARARSGSGTEPVHYPCPPRLGTSSPDRPRVSSLLQEKTGKVRTPTSAPHPTFFAPCPVACTAVVRRQRQGRSDRHLARRAALIHGIQQVRTADDNRHASGPDSNFSSQGKPNMSNLDISDSGRSVM